jgi:hypothetical protein
MRPLSRMILEAEMFARSLLAAIAFVMAVGSHAQAAPLIYGTYYDETVSGVGCTNAGGCRLNFSQTPADKLLMVSKISCRILTSGTAQSGVTDITLQISATSGGVAIQRHLPIQIPFSQTINSAFYVNVREDAHYLIGQGRFPFIFVGTGVAGSTIFMDCTIVGDLVTPIQ